MQTTLKTDQLRGEIAPLYCRYPRQTTAQPACVELDMAGNITAGFNGDIGGAISFDVFHKRTLTWSVAAQVRGDALADLLESYEMRALFERVYAGHEVNFDGTNQVGTLNEGAQEASYEIEAKLDAISEDEDSMGAVWPVENWLEPTHRVPFADLWGPGKSLDEAVDAVEKSAEAEGVELDGDVKKYLLDRAERENESGDCYRPEVLAALHADGRHPVDANGDEWTPPALQCQSGQATGERCKTTIADESELTTIEWMPIHLRASHKAAGNSGTYPSNGALRLRVCAGCAEELSKDE